MRQSRERVERLEQAIADSVPDWSLAPIVEALQALRGIDLISAVVFMSEIGDLSRFESPRQLMGISRPCAIGAVNRRERHSRMHH